MGVVWVGVHSCPVCMFACVYFALACAKEPHVPKLQRPELSCIRNKAPLIHQHTHTNAHMHAIWSTISCRHTCNMNFMLNEKTQVFASFWFVQVKWRLHTIVAKWADSSCAAAGRDHTGEVLLNPRMAEKKFALMSTSVAMCWCSFLKQFYHYYQLILIFFFFYKDQKRLS